MAGPEDAGPASVRGASRLSGRTQRRGLGIAGLVSLVVMLAGAAAANAAALTLGASLFAAAGVGISLVFLRTAIRWPDVAGRAPRLPAYVAQLQASRLQAIAYAWGAIAMQGLHVTPLTGLRWQHAWQYALAMALLAAGAFAYGRTLPRPVSEADAAVWHRHARWAGPLALAQAFLASSGLAWLWASGKLGSARADWAANRVFAGLALVILALSLAILIVERRLGGRR